LVKKIPMAARNRKSNIYLAIVSVNVKVLESLSTTAELNVRLPVIFSYMTGLPNLASEEVLYQKMAVLIESSRFL
jgi:hypothetical protein